MTSLLSSAIVIVALGLWPAMFQEWEDKTLDARFGLRQHLSSDSRLILIDCDDTSVAQLGRWPWDRAVHALMVEILASAGAKAVAFDIVFSIPSSTSDLRLMKAMTDAKNVYLPIGLELHPPLQHTEVDTAALERAQKMLTDLLGNEGLPWKVSKDDTSLLVTGRLFMPEADFAAAARGVGHIASNRDPDGVIRRVPLVVRVHDRLLPAFSLRVAMGVLDVPSDHISVVPGEYVELRGVQGGVQRRTRIPIDARGQMLVNYVGKWTQTFLPQYGFSEVLALAATPEGRREINSRFKGATVLILTTATGFDLKPTPVDVAAPGGIIHANALNTILTERWLRSPSYFQACLWAILLGLVAAVVVSGHSWKVALAGVVGSVAVYWGLAFFLFQGLGVVMPIIAPLMAFLLTVVVVPVHEQTAVRVRLAFLERQMHETESALVSSRQQLESHDRNFDTAIDQARQLREKAAESNERVHEAEARFRALDEALQKAHIERDRLVSQVEDLEQRLQDFKPVVMTQKVALSENDEALRAECEAHGIITGDRRMIEVFHTIKKVAPASSAVLLMGETGTGKELVARALHALSPRAQGPFVAVNMAAITETLAESELFGHVRGSFTGAHADTKGRFEQADQGTLFLDEIGELSADLQSKLLRVLQTGEVDRVGGSTPRKVDVRIIAATNRNLEDEVRTKRFRDDLYYRLNVVQIILPPLRERPGDIERLAERFLRELAAKTGKAFMGFSEKAIHMLRRQEWRGNVRDLRNAVERAVVMAEGTLISDTDLGLVSSAEPAARAIAVPQDGGDISGDGAFLVIMRELSFEIDGVAERLGLSRGTVASRLKGICFQALVSHDARIADAAADVAGTKDPLVEAKVREYYDNLMEAARQFPSADVAVLECRRRFKNLPQRYFPSVENLIRRGFSVSAP